MLAKESIRERLRVCATTLTLTLAALIPELPAQVPYIFAPSAQALCTRRPLLGTGMSSLSWPQTRLLGAVLWHGVQHRFPGSTKVRPSAFTLLLDPLRDAVQLRPGRAALRWCLAQPLMPDPLGP